jgi:hypothetical protein
MASEDNEPAKLTEEMRAVITNEHFENDMLKSAKAVSEESTPDIEPEEDTYIETAKPEAVKSAQAKIRKSKIKPVESESQSLSKLHGELRKHSDARKKTDLAIKDIEKQLKSLLLAHHSAIRDLTKQVNQMRSKLATLESKKSAAKKKVNKTTSKKSKRISKKSIKKR